MIKQTVYIPVNGEQDKVVCEDYNDWMDKITGVKEVSGYFFTPEQLKQLLEDYTNRIVENATITYTEEKTWDFTEVDKESITSQLTGFLKENGYE
jgi:hypothetical protein